MRYYRNLKLYRRRNCIQWLVLKLTCDELCLYSGEKYYAKPDLYKVFIRTSHLLLLLTNEMWKYLIVIEK